MLTIDRPVPLAPATVPARLTLSNDRKVTPMTSGKDPKPVVPNSLGLRAGRAHSCPGATSCEIACYADAAEDRFPNVRKVVDANLAALRACHDDVWAMADLLDDAIARFYVAHEKAEKRFGPMPKVFRIHWDGDFFSVAYGQAWRKVILAYPDVQFWVYTRSFVPSCNVVPDLHDLPNLSLYLSVDADNTAWAGVIVGLYPTVKIAALGDSYEAAQKITTDLIGRRAPRCPENARKVPLVSANGEGACVTCGLCIYGRQPVLFSTSHK